MIKELLSFIAIALTFMAFVPYIRSILKGQIKPHVFSWIIWGSTTFVVFLAQLADKGGVGAWPIGISGLVTIYIAFLAYLKKSDNSITRSDWVFFITAMTSLPLWYITSDPMWAVLILTMVDVLGFVPSFRKSYYFPYEEQLRLFVIMTARNLIVIPALEHYSITTILFPATIAITCVIFILMVIVRRRKLSNTTSDSF